MYLPDIQHSKLACGVTTSAFTVSFFKALTKSTARTESRVHADNRRVSYSSYRILQESVDGLCSCSMRIRGSMGLPEIVMESLGETDPSGERAGCRLFKPSHSFYFTISFPCWHRSFVRISYRKNWMQILSFLIRL